MKAIVQDRYGSPQEVLELKDIDKPAAKDGEVLLRAHAASVNPADWHLIRGAPYIARLQWGCARRRTLSPVRCGGAGRGGRRERDDASAR